MASSKAGNVASHPGATQSYSALAQLRSPEEREQKVY